MSTSKKLSLDQRLEIRRRAESGETRVALAKEFGVHEKTIRRIIAAVKSEQIDLPTGPRRSKVGMGDTRLPNVALTPVRASHSPNVRYGDVIVTREGSYIQRNADGEMIRVLSCPVYNNRHRCIGRYNVEVLSMNGQKQGTGSFKRHSGETIIGRLNFSSDGGMVSRIEFYQDQPK